MFLFIMGHKDARRHAPPHQEGTCLLLSLHVRHVYVHLYPSNSQLFPLFFLIHPPLSHKHTNTTTTPTGGATISNRFPSISKKISPPPTITQTPPQPTQGATVDAPAASGVTALWLAAGEGRTDIVQLLADQVRKMGMNMCGGREKNNTNSNSIAQRVSPTGATNAIESITTIHKRAPR